MLSFRGPVAACAVLLATGAAACSARSAALDAPFAPDDVPGHTPGLPGLGAYALAYYKLDYAPVTSTIATPARATAATGSTILVGVARGDRSSLGTPTDSVGNGPYVPVDGLHAYSLYPKSGAGVYALTGARGGDGFAALAPAGLDVGGPNPGRHDEVTIAMVEVADGKKIQAARWLEDRTAPNTSPSVTTTGPATLVAFWFGDGFTDQPQAAVPDSGFTVVATNTQETGSFVQAAVAVRNVTDPGTYQVSWTPSPAQGAQLWLIAVQ